MKDHICKERKTCTCYLMADSPNENCPVHGVDFPPRCGICGKFMKWRKLDVHEKYEEKS